MMNLILLLINDEFYLSELAHKFFGAGGKGMTNILFEVFQEEAHASCTTERVEPVALLARQVAHCVLLRDTFQSLVVPPNCVCLS